MSRDIALRPIALVAAAEATDAASGWAVVGAALAGTLKLAPPTPLPGLFKFTEPDLSLWIAGEIG